MNIARCLKLKNRLTQKISKFQRDIIESNSIPESSEREVNVEKLDELRSKTVKELIDLKLKIEEASRPIREHILKIGELKSEIEFLKQISYERGEVLIRRPYQTQEVAEKYTTILTKRNIDDRIKKSEEEIDSLQEEIDNHNYTTEIEIEILS